MNSCIDENVIGQLFDHRLSKSEVDGIDRHVAHCADCRELLCSLARLYAASSPSRALVHTVALLDYGETTIETGQAAIQRLLTVLGCERQVGKVLGGKWRLEGVLGVGGMAEVYAATHLSNGRRAAIKLLRREWVSRPNVVYRFLREGYVANRIGHPGVVTILDDGTTDDGVPFLVLELLDGHSIGSHVRDRLPISTVLWIASEILDVLASAHEQHIVHRDIKPDNVFLTTQGAIKVLDFGIARTREPAGEGAHRATQSGTLMGTPAYMPPEQARGAWDEIDARTDIWAVGATMFALLAGRPVRTEGRPNEMLAAAMTRPAPKLHHVAPEVPRAIRDVVDRALAFDRDDRWANARAMHVAICAVSQRAERVDSWPPVTVAAPKATESRRPRRWVGGAIVAAATMAALAIAAKRAPAPLAPSRATTTTATEPRRPLVVPETTARVKPVRQTFVRRVEKVASPVPATIAPVQADPPSPSGTEEHPLDRRD